MKEWAKPESNSNCLVTPELLQKIPTNLEKNPNNALNYFLQFTFLP